MNLKSYQTVYETAIRSAEQLLFRYKAQIVGLDSDDITMMEINYNDLIYRLENMIAGLRQQKVRYKFDKMSKEEFDALISNNLLGRTTKIITVGYEHKLSDLDTLQSISEKYSIAVSEILSYNKFTNQGFEDLKEQNGVLKIPTTVDLSTKTVYSELAVTGTHSGKNAWGIDWANEIEYDESTEDIRILGNEGTLLQGVQNAFGEKGDIPGYPDHVIEIEVGSDMDSELFDIMTMAQLQSKLLRDKRIRRVDDVQIFTEVGQKKINITVTPVNSENPIEPITKIVPIN